MAIPPSPRPSLRCRGLTQISRLRRHAASFNLDLLELLLDSQILLKLDAKSGEGLRVNEGDGNLVLWDFHDLVFHTRSTEGRQANPIGSTFAYASVVAPLPAVRPPWPGKKIDLCKFSTSGADLAVRNAVARTPFNTGFR